MSKARDRLTAVQIKNLNKPGFYHDGGGLYLQISRFGSKSWILRYTLNQKKRDMGLGPLTDWTLAEARERAKKYRQLVDDGIDPIDQRDQEKARMHAQRLEADRKRRSFEECAKEYHAANKDDWKNAKHADQWTNTLQTYAAPIIGKMDVALIETAHIMRVLEPVWHTKAETASRLRGRLEAVLDWATVHRYRTGDNPARWKGHLDALLPARSKVAKSKHFAALPWRDMKPFMAELRQQSGIGALALQFTILTAARSGEVRGMAWYEVDFEHKLWTVPGERMKAGKEHRVPLSDAAMQLLESLKDTKLADTDIVFPSTRDHKPLSDMTLTAVLRRMKRDDITVHGFRSSFRDWAAEATDYPQEMAEMALAHIVGNKVEAAYRRGDMLEKRRAMMQAWAEHSL